MVRLLGEGPSNAARAADEPTARSGGADSARGWSSVAKDRRDVRKTVFNTEN